MLERFLHKISHMWDTYDKVSNLFAKPIIKFFFSKKRNSPVFFHNTTISLGKNKSSYWVRNSVLVKDKDKVYHTITHKIPHNLKYAWKRDIRKKMRKFGLGWVKPYYVLPDWLTFGFFNFDVQCKSKWDYYSYELPPTFGFCIFGYVFAWYLHSPVDEFDSDGTHYWEMIYTVAHSKNKVKFNELVKENLWKRYNGNKVETIYTAMRPTYVLPEYRDEYNKIVEELNVH